MALSDDQLFQQYRDRIKADPLNRYVINWQEVFQQSTDVGRRLTEWTNSQEYFDLIDEAERRKADNNVQPADPSTTTSEPTIPRYKAITTSQPSGEQSERPDVYEVYQVSSGGAGPNKLVAVRVGDARPQNVVQYLGQKKRTDTVPYMQQDVSVDDIVNGTISFGGAAVQPDIDQEEASPPVYQPYGGAGQQPEIVEEEVSPPVYQPYGGAAEQPDTDQEQGGGDEESGGGVNIGEIWNRVNQDLQNQYGQYFSPDELTQLFFEFGDGFSEGGSDLNSQISQFLNEKYYAKSIEAVEPVEEVDVDYRPAFDGYYNRYASSAYADIITSLPNADELFEQWKTSYDGQGDPGYSISSFFQDQILQAQQAQTDEGLTDDELLQDYIDRISADPLNATVVDWNTLSAENPEVAQRLTQWTNSQEYFDLVDAAEGRGGDGGGDGGGDEAGDEAGDGTGDGAGDGAGDEAGDETGDGTSNIEVLQSVLRNQDYINRVKQHFSEGGNRDNVSAVIDSILSELNISDNQKADLKADLSYFLSNEAESQLAVDNLEKDDTEVVDEGEGEGVVVDEGEDEGDSVVVTDVAGNDLEPTGTTEDFDEFVAEVIDIIDTMSFVTLDDLNDVKSSLEGVFTEYKDVVTSLADAEAAKNIIDGHIETILSNALEQSSTLFATFDSEQTFGRETRSGLEVTMENIISQLEIDKEGLIAKQSNLINLRYDQALERLARKGLLEGGGISASGTNILAATDLEQQRTQDLVQAEIELDEKLRGELRETLTLIDTIARSRTDEAIAQQQSRLDTSQQLLDFIVELENLRLGSRSVSVEERGMTLEEYRSSVDEKIREAEITGRFNGEETLALREMLSRVEIENRRLDLENKIAEASISVEERFIALQELVDLKRVEIEARRYNLEEALGLRGMSLSERRLILDEFLGNAGVEQAEREHVLNQLLGEGDLAIRRDLADLEAERFELTSYLEGKRLLLEQQAQEIESGQINRRIAIEENRMELDRFIANNRATLDKNALEIERQKVVLDRNRFELESQLGVGRLAQDAQALELEERKLMLEDLVSHNRLRLEERQIAFEEIMYNSDLELRERAQFIDEITKRQNLDRLDRELLMQQMLANSQVEQGEWEFFLRERIAESDMSAREQEIAIARLEVQLGERQLSLQERQQELDERFRIAEATGVIIDQNGFVVPTLAAKAQEQSDYLAQQGLDLEAQRLQQSASQFTRELNAQTKQWADQYNLDAGQAQALQAQIYAEIDRNKQQLDMQLEEMLHQQYITLEDLGLRQGELDLSRIKVSNDQELAQARLELDRNTLSAQIEQQEYDRALELKRHADNLGLEYDQLAQMWNQAAADREQALYLASQEFGLEEERLTLMRFQVEEDVRLRGLTLEQSAEQWAAEFGLEEEAALQAIRFAEEEHRARMTAMALDNNMTQTQINALNSEWNAFMLQEARRDELWSMAMDGNMLNTPEGRQKFAAFMALAQGIGYSPAYPPAEQDDGGIVGAFGEVFASVLGEEAAKEGLRQLGVGG